MTDYNIHTNKSSKSKQNVEFLQKIDYDAIETLILNITSNMHLNNNKTEAMTWIYLIESNPKKWNKNLSSFFKFSWPPYRHTVATHCALTDEDGVLCPPPYIYRHICDGHDDTSIARRYCQT
jgi:hypothetical protein